jgi:hypothetical protein
MTTEAKNLRAEQHEWKESAMRRLVLGAAAAGGAAFALHRLARKAHTMHERCREMMQHHCGAAGAGCRPE